MMGKLHVSKIELDKLINVDLFAMYFFQSEIKTNKSYFLSVYKVFFSRKVKRIQNI